MQLRVARVCLDCEELHDARQCPVCASQSFAYLTRWVPAPERRMSSRPAVEQAPKGEEPVQVNDVPAAPPDRLGPTTKDRVENETEAAPPDMGGLKPPTKD